MTNPNSSLISVSLMYNNHAVQKKGKKVNKWDYKK